MTYQEIKKNYSDNINRIMEQQKVFWAFNQSQLEEGKAKIGIQDNKLLMSIGMGGFCPRANADELMRLMKEEDARYHKELKDAKEQKEQAILYELYNHESYYTGDLEPVIEIFKGLYTPKEIRDVYLKAKKNQ